MFLQYKTRSTLQTIRALMEAIRVLIVTINMATTKGGWAISLSLMAWAKM
jgi:hypothetical protein